MTSRVTFLRMLGVICLVLPLLVFDRQIAHADLVLYSNDFDGSIMTAAGASALISGGTANGKGINGGIVNSQGFDSQPGFGGDFWRVTAENDVLDFTINNVPMHDAISVGFSLGMLDSWDGTNGTYGSDIINIGIFDGGTQIAGLSEAYSGNNAPSSNVESILVQNRQLGFNNGGQPWWNDDGYRMRFDNLVASSGVLSIRVWASSGGSGQGFQGGNDESFAIDELMVTYTIPEPSATCLGLISSVLLLMRRKRS